jgi:AhpC/TSA family
MHVWRRGDETMRTSAVRAAVVLTAVTLVVLLAIPGGAAAVQIGDKAPDFKLPATTGGQIRLSDFRGKQLVLLEFYHADWGPT